MRTYLCATESAVAYQTRPRPETLQNKKNAVSFYANLKLRMTDYWSLNQAWKRASCQAIRRALASDFHIQKVQGLKFVGYEFRSFSACGGCFYSSCPKIDGDQPIIEFLRPLPFLRHRSIRIKWAGLIQATLYKIFTRNSLVQVSSP